MKKIMSLSMELWGDNFGVTRLMGEVVGLGGVRWGQVTGRRYVSRVM